MDTKKSRQAEAKCALFMNKFRHLFIIFSVLTAFGCAESAFPVATGKGNVRALNSAVTTPDIGFLIEERVIGLARYKESTAVQVYDDLDYVFNFDYQFAGDIKPTRLASAPLNLIKDTDYIFVFLGSLDNAETMIWDNPLREWEDTDTVIEVWFGQLSPDLGEIDVYFALTGTTPVLGEARATLSYKDRSTVIELPEGEYEFIVTSKDNPADILFISRSFNYVSRLTYLVSTFDTDPSITSPVSARIISESGASIELANVDSPPTLRIFHAAITTGSVDVYRDADFSAPLIANTGYAEASTPVSTPQEEVTYTFTDAGNVGSIVLEEDFALFDGHRTTRFLVGETPDFATLLTVDNVRPIADRTKIRFIQTSINQSGVDIYVVETGTDIEDAIPRFFNVTSLSNTGYTNVIERDYEVFVTVTLTKDILAGPFALSATDGDIVHFAIVDNVDPTILDLVKYDHLGLVP